MGRPDAMPLQLTADKHPLGEAIIAWYERAHAMVAARRAHENNMRTWLQRYQNGELWDDLSYHAEDDTNDWELFDHLGTVYDRNRDELNDLGDKVDDIQSTYEKSMRLKRKRDDRAARGEVGEGDPCLEENEGSEDDGKQNGGDDDGENGSGGGSEAGTNAKQQDVEVKDGKGGKVAEA